LNYLCDYLSILNNYAKIYSEQTMSNCQLTVTLRYGTFLLQFLVSKIFLPTVGSFWLLGQLQVGWFGHVVGGSFSITIFDLITQIKFDLALGIRSK